MSVLMPNARLAVRRWTGEILDSAGYPLPNGWDPSGVAYPGRARERGDGGWSLGVDPALWPIRARDIVVDADGGREWLVLTADLLQNNADHIVDWVRVEARERQGTSTEPGGPEFAAR